MKPFAFKVMTLILMAMFMLVPLAFSEQEWLPGYGDKNGRLGKQGQSWRVVWVNSVSMEGLTTDDFAALLLAVDPTANNILWLPDVSGILITNSGGEDMFNVTLIDGILNGVTEVEGELDINDGFINDVGYIDFNLDNGISCEEGRLSWNDTDGTLNICLKGGVVKVQVAQEQVVRGRNTTGVAITNGTPVRIGGVTGSNFLWGLSNAADPATAGAIGVATENIANGQFGYVTTFGLVRELDTTGTPVGEVWSSGDRIWVGNVSGELTNVAPTGSERKIFIGIICASNANEGILWVNPINQAYFNELSGPLLTDGSVVFINSAGMTVEDNDNFYWDDTNNRLGIGNATPLKTLDVAGESLFRDDVGPYGEFSGDDLDTLTLDAGVWANVPGLTNGVFSTGMALNNATGCQTVTYAGVYDAIGSYTISDPDSNSETYHFSYTIDGIDQEKCEKHRDVRVQSSLGAVPVTCLLDLAASEEVCAAMSSDGGDDVDIEHINWYLKR